MWTSPIIDYLDYRGVLFLWKQVYTAMSFEGEKWHCLDSNLRVCYGIAYPSSLS